MPAGSFPVACLMRIITFNANGIRSAASKGFFDWFAVQHADVLCLQETKAQEHQLDAAVYRPAGYHAHFHDARSKKGYSGVAIYARRKPDQILDKLGWEAFDQEGRYLEARFGNLSVVSLYVPSGSSGEERQRFKFATMERLAPILDGWLASGRDYVICGDWNIAHKEIDLKNWRGNRKNSGFLPEERAWLDQLFDEEEFVDAFRVVNQEEEQYTWWSNRGQAWAKNVGWRIDYHIITPGLRERVVSAAIYKDERFSDHAPLTLEYDYPFLK